MTFSSASLKAEVSGEAGSVCPSISRTKSKTILIARQSAVAERLTSCLMIAWRIVIFRRPPFSATMTGSFSASVSKVVSVKVYGDLTPGESDETVLVDLSTPVNATLAKSQGIVTIADDDSDGNTGLQVSIGDFNVDEADAGAHYAYLPITLSQPAPTTP